MKLRIIASLALAAAAGAAVAAEPVAFRAEAKVEIDATGKPTKIEASQDLPEAIRNHIEAKVATWKFAPPTRDGVTAHGVTYLTLGACAVSRVTDPYPELTSLSGTGPDEIVQQWRTMFEDSAMAVAKNWKFDINETVDGKPAADSAVRIPVEYSLGSLEKWQAKLIPVQGPSRIPAWGRSWQQGSSPAALRNGETQSLTSHFKLKNVLAGTYL